MRTDCHSTSIAFTSLGRRNLLAEFDGGNITSDAGVLLLREVAAQSRLFERMPAIVPDPRDPELIEHEQKTLFAQRVLGIACGWEDLNDHHGLRIDPLMQVATERDVDQEQAVEALGEQTEAAEQWLGKVLHTLRHEGYEPFFGQLLDWRAPMRGNKRKAADELIGYAASRRDMIVYEKCGQHGWDVGSGPMESMCGVTTDRIKGRGRRWDIENAEGMMALEALYQSIGLWDQYWKNQLAQRN